MRLLKRLQLALREGKVTFSTGDELDAMSKVLDEAPGIEAVYEAVLGDVAGNAKRQVGRDGLSAERIVRLGVLRKRLGLTYRRLSEATADSLSVRRFLDLRNGETLSRSAIHTNLKAVSDSTWEKLNQCLVRYAVKQGYENGRTIRSDTTTVETNIHYPTDASLLNDCVRVLSREMETAKEIAGKVIEYTDHRRRAKSKLYLINNLRGEDARRAGYLELIRITRKTIEYAERVLSILPKIPSRDYAEMLRLNACESAIRTYIPLGKRVINQAFRRIVQQEKVPANEKVVSIFEPHSDIIVKGLRDVVFGHKVCLTTGPSCLILGLRVLDGNPKDSTLVPHILADHQETFHAAPERAAFDGCFASTANRNLLKQAGVQELTFSKNLSMPLDSLVSNPRIHRMLRRFRAGAEGCISFVKRVFSFRRVLDRSKETFAAALHLGAAACNLTLLARYDIARAAA